jgi:hypothetical protein
VRAPSPPCELSGCPFDWVFSISECVASMTKRKQIPFLSWA